jgi:hypothetical protein
VPSLAAVSCHFVEPTGRKWQYCMPEEALWSRKQGVVSAEHKQAAVSEARVRCSRIVLQRQRINRLLAFVLDLPALLKDNIRLTSCGWELFVVIPTGALLARWTWRHIRTQMQITMYNRKTTTAITRTLKRNAFTFVSNNFRSTSSLETKTIQCLLRFFNGTQIRTERWQFRFLPNLYGRFVSVLNSATPRSATPLVNWMTTDHPVVVQIIFRFFLHQANLASLDF